MSEVTYKSGLAVNRSVLFLFFFFFFLLFVKKYIVFEKWKEEVETYQIKYILS